MRVFPATRRRVAATFAASALVAASAVSFAPGAPADERVLDSDERFAVIGAQTLPLADQDAVVVADLDGYFRAQLLAVLLGDEASALDVTQLVGGPVSDDDDALDGDDDVLEGGDDVLEGDEDALEGDDALEDLVTTVREADAVVVVDRARREDEVLLPAAQDDVRADEETPDPALPAECRASVVAWLAGLGTPAVVVTDRAASAETDDGEAGDEAVQSSPSGVAPSATSAPSSPPDDDDAPAGPDVVFVLEPTAGAAAVAAVLTGISEATGVMPEASPLESGIGDEAIHVRRHSTGARVVGNVVSDTGLREPEFGEGIYVGSAHSNWCRYTECEPDRSDGALIADNLVFATTAESIDIKEGTTGGIIERNQLDGSKITGPIPDSWVALKGNDWVVRDNRGEVSPRDGFQVTRVRDGWGLGNVLAGNTGRLGSDDGVLVATPE